MSDSSPGSTPEETRAAARRQPASPSLLPPGPRYRWVSSSVARVRSLHLILCPGGAGCLPSERWLSGDTSEDEVVPLDPSRITGANAISRESEQR